MLKRNIKMVFTTNALMLCTGVVTSLLSAWALGAEGRGDLMVVLLWPAVLTLAVSFGLPTAYRFWIARQPERVSALFSNALLLTLLLGFAAVGLAWITIPLLIGRRNPEVIRLAQIYSLMIPMTLLTDLIRGLLEGVRRFDWVAALRLIFFGFQAVSFVILWFMGQLTLANAMYTMIGSAAVSLAMALIAVWWELRPTWDPKLSELRTSLHYGVRDYPGVLTEFVNWRLHLMMLVGTGSSLSVGLYSVAISLADIATTLASSVGDALLPEIAASKKADEATRMVTRSFRLMLFINLLALIPLWIAAPYILSFAYGESFVPATSSWRLLMIASIIWSLAGVVISGLKGFGYPGLSTIARLASAGVMVLALLAWLPTRGIQGAAWSAILGYGVMLVVAMFWLLRRRHITLWECLRPRWDDIPRFSIAGFDVEAQKLRFRRTELKSQAGEAVPGKVF